MQYYFHLVPLYSGILNLLLAIFVLVINPRRRLNRIYFAMASALAWWNFGAFTSASLETPSAALMCVRLTLAVAVFLPTVLYHFTLETIGTGARKRTLYVAYGVSFAFLALDLTPYFIESVRPYGYSMYRASAGPAFWIFFGGFYPIAAYATIRALVLSLKTTPASSARGARLLLIAIAVLCFGGFHDMLPLLGFDRYPGTEVSIRAWGTLAASLHGFILAYSILSDQLLDVRISISRHSAAVLRLCFFASIAYLLMLAVGTLFVDTFTRRGLAASMMVLVGSAVITARFSPKLFGGLSGRMESGVLGDRFEYQDKVRSFIDSEPRFNSLQSLLDQTVDLVFRQFCSSAVCISIVSGDSKTRGQSIRVTGSPGQIADLTSIDSVLVQYFRAKDSEHINVRDDFRSELLECAARSALISARVELSFVIGSRSKDPLGVLVLGPRRDGRPLTRLDVELLQKLCRNLEARVERIAILQNEELRQANNARDRFLASINHEIRNPLNGITGIVEMLSANYSGPRSEYLLSSLRACTEQLRSSMDEVLDFTQIEADAVTVTTANVDLKELIRSTCAGSDVLQARLLFKNAPATEILVQCDPGKVRQVLSNYLGNAIKYGEPPGAEVDLLANECGPGVMRITINVTSSGPTLSADELNVLFTALTRGRRARETSAHGTGLGLALCKKLAHAMGGSVGVESANEKTTFWFKADFPVVSGDAIQPVSIYARYSGCRALAVEDESFNRLVLEHHLTKFGLTPTWAENGAAAVIAATTHTFDVILMDWLLPDMDGPELLQKLKEIRRGSLPPVIVLSAYSTTNKRAECLAAGAVAFVSKPIDLAKLSAAFELCKLEESQKVDAPIT